MNSKLRQKHLTLKTGKLTQAKVTQLRLGKMQGQTLQILVLGLTLLK